MNTNTEQQTEQKASVPPDKRAQMMSHEQLIKAASEIVPTATTTLFKIRGQWVASRAAISFGGGR